MKKLSLFIALMTVLLGYSQTNYLTVDAGTDLIGGCGQSQNLAATFTDLKETTTYTVVNIPYAPLTDFSSGTDPFAGAATTEDMWSSVVDLGFSFCYFGNTYTQITIGSNAEVSFNTAYSGNTNHFDFSAGGVPITLPQPNDDSNLAFNTIYGPGHDTNVGNPVTNIKYELIGTAPYRAMVIKYDNVEQFGCNTLHTTSMIVINETTNNIDVIIKEKPICSSWNNGYAVVGINNIDGTVAVTPPGRNTSAWNVDLATSEAWRFIPNGASVTAFEWTDATGTGLGTTASITVNPSMTTVYTATATYTNCTGDVTTISDEVTVSTQNGPIVDLGADTQLCDNNTIDLDATPSNAADFATITYLWSTGETTAIITPTTTGTYSVEVTADGGCMAVDEIVLSFGLMPEIAFDGSYYLCHSAISNDPIVLSPSFGSQDTSSFTYSWFEAGSSIPIATTQSLSVTEPGTYTLTVTGGSCSSTETVTVDYYANEYCVYPEGISPNGDNMNENFDLSWLNDIEGIKNLKFFNRHGALVYEKDNYSNEFVGKSDKDYDLPTGTYFYVLTLADDTVKNGYLYINR